MSHPDYNRQDHLRVYGDGPVDPELGHPCGCQDVAYIKLEDGFKIVRTEYLDALEDLVRTQAERIKQLEAKK